MRIYLYHSNSVPKLNDIGYHNLIALQLFKI